MTESGVEVRGSYDVIGLDNKPRNRLRGDHTRNTRPNGCFLLFFSKRKVILEVAFGITCECISVRI